MLTLYGSAGSGSAAVELALQSCAVPCIAANCYAAIGVIDCPERWCVEGDQVPLDGVREGARRRLHACWTVFADQFGAALCQARDEPGALDFLAVVVSRWSGARAHLTAHRLALAATLQRIQSHPNVAPVWARHGPN